MNVGAYQLVGQLGAGEDGVSYRALRPDSGTLVELRVLTRAPQLPRHWTELTERIRLAAMVDHLAALQVLELDLGNEPPLIVLEWSEGDYLTHLIQTGPPLPVVLSLGCQLAGALGEAHQIGLAHGHMCPSRVRCIGDAKAKIDLFHWLTTRTPLSSDEEQWDSFCHTPDWNVHIVAPCAEDVYGLGMILSMLLGHVPEDDPSREQLAGTLNADPRIPPALSMLMQRTLLPDPDQRPLAVELAAQLQSLSQGVSGNEQVRADANLDDPANERSPHETSVSNETIDQEIQPSKTSTSQADTVIRTPAIETDPPTADAGGARLPDAPLQIGCQLGRYRLLQLLGEGGMGTVYRAEDLADGSMVAIKVVSPRYAQQPEALTRFRKEARLLAEVDNPYVTKLREVNQADGIHYLAMEYVQGQSLAELLVERGSVEEELAVSMMADVARALEEPHERGIVHRDIKAGKHFSE